MNQELLNELLQITDEEKSILEQQAKVSKELYTSKTNFIIESEKFLSKDKMIMVRQHTRFVDFPLHKHDYIEVNYVYNGKLEQTVGGRPIILKKGELLLLNQHIEHEIKACAKEDIVINFIIRPAFFDFIFSYLSSGNIVSDFLLSSLYNNTQNGQFLYFKVSEIEDIQDLIRKIIHEIMYPTTFSESAIKLYMGLFMIELIKNSDRVERKEEASITHYLVVESLKYIEEHYKEASLYELAEQLNQSHYGLSKTIKKATSRTFKDLLQERRLGKAKEMLEGTDLPIASIVEQVGYYNISYFYRIFKVKFGQTPKEFRANK
ncbi:helix-turn-helix domain-containing protein [Bacillus sp. EB106-08-02-XG196]|uniref:AraC family transcriptional regulator n=1 Tax=Bacillus sp. EB106-08-02-XG196 TaxID=2737049 RepID=UPI0015C496C0|nr:helix-turn-helix domain-containing protein [Bacillus sp. EB106-08-02-XG196]NWQ41692.1 helix-turn-helix domain-containing protein [Bacillus sp. EB106-08-02-XG196]